MSEAPERRDESRFQASLPAVLHVGGIDHHCLGYDLSRKGLRLVGEIPPESGPDVEVTLRSAASDLQLRCTAQITRSETGEEGRVHLGLVLILMFIFPFSKLLHAPGVFFSPSRNQVDNPREKRHIAPWAAAMDPDRSKSD